MSGSCAKVSRHWRGSRHEGGSEQPGRAMSVRLEDSAAWEFLTRGHTGIFTSLRRDGVPISLPIWFVVLDGAIYTRTPGVTTKLRRVEHDSRACFLVEAGQAWKELRAVMVVVSASVVHDEDLKRAADEAINQKYLAFSTPRELMPERTRKYMNLETGFIRMDPVEAPISWDNRRIELADPRP